MSCKGCSKRRVGCHGECEDYKAYRAEKDRQNARRQQENDVLEYINGNITKVNSYKLKMRERKRNGYY